MDAYVTVKLRRVGTSVGAIIPKKYLDSGGFKIGDIVGLSLSKKRRAEEIEKLVGSAKWLKGWEREDDDRY
jgi:antitoxin component of MazEF toxin-antitoxin module